MIVVGAIVAAAVALHFAEQAKGRRVIAARKAARAEEERGLRWVTATRQLHEEWRADLEAMTLSVSRRGAAPFGEEELSFQLLRGQGGAWQMRSSREAEAEPLAVPSLIAAQLEAQYARYSRQPAQRHANSAGKRQETQ